ncbi:MAG: ornithine cyclodeaminase family protein [Thaumarchaeota archaeon]|nr:ornithine cyclodeaminase family protein [Nitrososphaerota archaeon]
MPDILVLSRTEVEQLLNMDDTIRTMEEVFAASSRREADSIGVLHIDASKFGGFWSVKPGYLVHKGYVGVKLGCGYPANSTKGIPTTLAAVLLSDATNGLPLAVLDGVYITGVRTGATGGVAAKYLARKESSVVGVVGTGMQGRMQVLALKNLFKLKEVRAYDIDAGRLSAYVGEMEQRMGVPVKSAISPEVAVRGADIVITVTPSKTPYVMDDWIRDGTHVNAFGADAHGKQELDKATYKRAKLVTDNVEVALEKELFERKDIYGELGELVTGAKRGRENGKERTIFDSTGLGIQDVAAASLAFEKAKKQGVGKWVKFI